MRGPVARALHGLGLVLALLLTSACSSGHGLKGSWTSDPSYVSDQAFGLHVQCLDRTSKPCPPKSAWPAVPFGAIRLWRTGTAWSQLEPAKGKFRFGHLDALVDVARSHHVSILLTLGQTPRWASSRPDEHAFLGRGAAAPPNNLSDWTGYVSAVVTRYRGRISAYEVWTQPNTTQFYSGTAPQLASLATAAAAVIHRIDKHATVVSPSVEARASNAAGWVRSYAAAGGYRTADVVGVYLQPYASQVPSATIFLLNRVRSSLPADATHKPVWDTWVSFGRASSGRVFPGAAGRARVAQAYIFAAAMRVARTYWFAWDDRASGVFLTTPADIPSDAATAYHSIHDWLVGSHFQTCAHLTKTYVCSFAFPNAAVGEIYFSELPTASVRLPLGAMCMRTLLGRVTKVTAGQLLTVTTEPILVLRAAPGQSAKPVSGLPASGC